MHVSSQLELVLQIHWSEMNTSIVITNKGSSYHLIGIWNSKYQINWIAYIGRKCNQNLDRMILYLLRTLVSLPK